MRFPLSWPERLYGLVFLVYPKSFRDTYEHEMRRVFRELLHDGETSRPRLIRMAAGDLVAGILRPEHLPTRDMVEKSVLYGLLIVAFSIAALALHPGASIDLALIPVPFIAFIPAAFWGSRRSASFAGGIWVALIVGTVSSSTVFFDWMLFGSFPFNSLYDFVLAMLLAAAFCLGPAVIGAVAGAATASGREIRPEGRLRPPPSTGGAR